MAGESYLSLQGLKKEYCSNTQQCRYYLSGVFIIHQSERKYKGRHSIKRSCETMSRNKLLLYKLNHPKNNRHPSPLIRSTKQFDDSAYDETNLSTTYSLTRLLLNTSRSVTSSDDGDTG